MKRTIGFLIAVWILGFIARSIGHSGSSDGGMVKAVLVPIATVYLDLFNSPSTALFLCAGMVALAACLFLYYYIGRISPALGELDAIADDIRRIPARPGDPEKTAALNDAMARHPLMARAWKLYYATLANDGTRVSSPFPPSRYLNMRALEHAGLRLRFFLGLPNDFVGLGLIFTFLGLVAGLYFASKSMLSADLSEARNALTMLLHAATFKFLTSITGIGISMVGAGAQRIMLDRLQSGLDELQYLVEERIPPSEAGHAAPARHESIRLLQASAQAETVQPRLHEAT